MTAAAPVPALAAQADRVLLSAPAFISDLHLNAAQPATRAAFARFVRDIAPGCAELLILGDLFEYWAGDDGLDDAGDAVGREVAAHLRALADAGVRVFVMHGNRDLLLGRRFCAAAGATLLADPTLATIGTQDVLLAHGDAWCTQDLEYMTFRAQARQPAFQAQFLAQPLAARRAYIGQARAASEAGKAAKSMAIMDVTPAEVDAALRRAGVTRLIHGHTHRPATHRFALDGQAAERWVLPDWDLDAEAERGGYLAIRDGEWTVKAVA